MKKIIYLLALVLIPIFLIAQEKDNAELKRLVFSNYSVAQASDFTSTTTYNV
jgi:hypothetical protein